MSEYYNCCKFNYNTLNESKIKKYIDLIIMQEKYISFSFGTKPFKTDKSKIFYYTIKKIYGPAAYLDLTRKNASWESVSETEKNGSHKLFLETGRYDDILGIGNHAPRSFMT